MGESYRTCVGCRTRKPKKELWRLVCDRDLKLIIDPRQRLAGRGVYLCKDLVCAQKAIKGKAFTYALRKTVVVPPEFLKTFHGD